MALGIGISLFQFSVDGIQFAQCLSQLTVCHDNQIGLPRQSGLDLRVKSLFKNEGSL